MLSLEKKKKKNSPNLMDMNLKNTSIRYNPLVYNFTLPQLQIIDKT